MNASGPKTDQQAALVRLWTIHKPERWNSVKQWASKNCLCVRQFERRFKKRFGLSPKKSLNRERMAAARDLLLKTLTIKEVASQLDFRNASHFCHAFRKCFGISPSQCAAVFYAGKTEGAEAKVAPKD